MKKQNLTIDAVIFDLDGTLLNTLKDLADCYNRVLVSQGYPRHPESAYRHFVGDGARKCMERALPESARHKDTIDHCLALQKVDYMNNWAVATRPYKGIPELLHSLEEKKIRMAVLSNKDQQFSELCVTHFFDKYKFDVIQGHQPGIANKPDPAGCILIAEKMGLDVNHFALLGDSAMDMQAARRSGMLGVGASWGFRSKKELIAAGAFAIIDSPDELIGCLCQ